MSKKKITNTPQGKALSNHAATLPSVIRRTISQTRKDIEDWKRALLSAGALKEPRQYVLQDLYNTIADDALLSSQINNRKEQTITALFEMRTPDKKVDENATQALMDIPILQDLFSMILDSEYYGYSLVELSIENGNHKAALIPRANVVPDFGRFYPNAFMSNYIPYRDTKEYGQYILEFNSDHYGILNKAVPHILFKKFAQSCWSELCEIYGIPPRYLKTNTQDPVMLNNAENMMRDIGAAAWFIIDTTEDFEFAQAMPTNGDVYNNLIRLCSNEISMLINGAIIGQDTKNGNESKEKISLQIADRLVDSDKRMIEMYMNSLVIPAFIRIGWVPSTTSKFKFSTIEDADKLWSITKDLLPFKEVDDEWIIEKFGVKVTGSRNQSAQTLNFQ